MSAPDAARDEIGERLVEAAAAVFSERGYDGARVQEIARRAGLTTVTATMAGGPQSVTVLDVPEDVGTALAHRAVPGLVEQFLEPTPTASPAAG